MSVQPVGVQIRSKILERRHRPEIHIPPFSDQEKAPKC